LFQETAFPSQPLGYPIIGRPDVVKSFTRQDIQDYRENKYVTSNMIAAAAGKIDHEKFVELISQHFTNLRNTSPPHIEQGEYKGGDLRVTRDLEQAHLVLGFPSVKLGHEDYYATS